MKTRPLAMAAAAGLAVVAPLALIPSAAAAPGTPEDSAPQRYVVRTDSVRATGRALDGARENGVRVRNTYEHVFAGFSATLTPDQLRSLRQDPHVRAIVPDRRLHASATQTAPAWGLDRIDQRSTTGNGSYRYDRTGRGVTAYVVDTGIRISHTQFGGRARSGYDFVDYDSNANDCDGHGTHVAGTIGGSTYGVAKGASLVAVRVLDCEGSGWLSDIVDGLDWVVGHRSGPAVVNLSLGGEADGVFDEAVRQTVAAGVSVVVAAGNEEMSACSASPARVSQAITVSATDSRDTRPYWANYGRCVDLFAPGVGIRSAGSASNTATLVASGTSMAAPHAAGVAVRYLETHRTATPSQVAATLVSSATTGTVKSTSGSPNRLLYAAPPATAPSAARSVTLTTTAAARSATLRWAAPSSTGGKTITAYRLTRNGKDSAGAGPLTTTVAASAKSSTFPRLLPNTRYTFSVQAVNAVGAGPAVSKTVLTAR